MDSKSVLPGHLGCNLALRTLLLDSEGKIRKRGRMTLCEEKLTRAIFNRLAGRRLPKKQIEEIAESIKVFGATIRAYPDLLEAIGATSIDRPKQPAYDATRKRGPMTVTTKHEPVGDIAYTIQVFKEGRFFVAHAPELDVSSQGEGVEAAKAHLREAVEAFLEEAQRMGTLTDVLEEAGYERTPDGWKAPDLLAQERAKATLPR